MARGARSVSGSFAPSGWPPSPPLVSNIGTWIQNVAAVWYMTSLTSSPLMVALVPAATSLPVILVGLPAGAVADIFDRRRLLLWTQGWMLAIAGLLAVLTFAGLTTAWRLLALTFALGLGMAMNAPSWSHPGSRDRRLLDPDDPVREAAHGHRCVVGCSFVTAHSGFGVYEVA